MSSKMEQIIEEIEEYIDGCKYQPLSNTRIIVNKEELEELIAELRSKTPEEIKRYQKIISNKEAILADAQAKADQIIAQAQIQTSELVSEHQIMQQAYAQANEVVMIATKQAQEILDNATNEAKYNDLSAKYEELSNKHNEILAEQHLTAAENLYEEFGEKLNGVEDYVKLKDSLKDIPLNELEEKLYSLVGRVQFKLNTKNNNSKSPKVGVAFSVTDKDEKPYGDLFSY